MRHQRTGKKLGRDSAHRRALYANLASDLIEHERIRTTLAKAKAVRPIAERMITLGRRGDIHARRQAVAFLGSKDIVHKLFAELGPRYAERPGGYSRIVRLGPRLGDAAEMVYLELVDTPLVFKQRLADGEGAVAGATAESDEVEPVEAEAEAEEEQTEEEGAEPASGAAVEEEPEGAEPAAEESAAEESAAEPAADADRDAPAPAAEADAEAAEPAAQTEASEPAADAEPSDDES
jgi:large subunit ribosomal protein L17